MTNKIKRKFIIFKNFPIFDEFYYQLDVSKTVSRNYGFQAIAYLQGYTWFKQLFCLMLKKLKPEKPKLPYVQKSPQITIINNNNK